MAVPGVRPMQQARSEDAGFDSDEPGDANVKALARNKTVALLDGISDRIHNLYLLNLDLHGRFSRYLLAVREERVARIARDVEAVSDATGRVC